MSCPRLLTNEGCCCSTLNRGILDRNAPNRKFLALYTLDLPAPKTNSHSQTHSNALTPLTSTLIPPMRLHLPFAVHTNIEQPQYTGRWSVKRPSEFAVDVDYCSLRSTLSKPKGGHPGTTSLLSVGCGLGRRPLGPVCCG